MMNTLIKLKGVLVIKQNKTNNIIWFAFKVLFLFHYMGAKHLQPVVSLLAQINK